MPAPPDEWHCPASLVDVSHQQVLSWHLRPIKNEPGYEAGVHWASSIYWPSGEVTVDHEFLSGSRSEYVPPNYPLPAPGESDPRWHEALRQRAAQMTQMLHQEDADYPHQRASKPDGREVLLGSCGGEKQNVQAHPTAPSLDLPLEKEGDGGSSGAAHCSQ